MDGLKVNVKMFRRGGYKYMNQNYTIITVTLEYLIQSHDNICVLIIKPDASLHLHKKQM